MLNFINAHGGVVAVVLSVVTLFNLVLGFISQVLGTLHKTVPAWVSKGISVIQTVIDWLTANQAHPQVSAQATDTVSAPLVPGSSNQA